MKCILTLCLCAALLCAVVAPGPAGAAALAEEHTVLYYLIEMQRRTKGSCDGVPMPEAPSLMPSETLRSMARVALATGGRAASSLGESMLTVTCVGSTPQQAVENLFATRCRQVMSAEWCYIGAYGEHGAWTVVMASRDPDQWVPAEPGQTSEPGRTPGADPEREPTGSAALGGAGGASIGAPAGTVVPSPPGSTAPTAAVAPGVPPAPGGSSGDAPSGPGSGTFTGPDTAKNEPREPAVPVPVGEIEIDALGRPILPSGRPGVLAPLSFDAPVLTAPPAPPVSAPAVPGSAPALAGSGEGTEPSRPSVTPLSDVRTALPSGGYYAMDGALGPGPGVGLQAPGPAAVPSPAGESGASAPVAPPFPRQEGQPGTPVVGTASVRVAQTASDPMVMLGLVNAVRAGGAVCAGTPMPPVRPLAPDARLMASAQKHAEDMAARNYFSSTSPESVTLGQRLSGYSWGFLAENIARGAASPERTLESWMAGDGQCRNIMDPEYTQAGAGFASQGAYWVLTFAAPMPSGDGLRLR